MVYRNKAQSIRNNSARILLFKQTHGDVESMYNDIGGYDMKYDEFEEMCRKTWENDYDYLQIYRFAKTGEDKYTIGSCNKSTYIESTPEAKFFWLT